MRSVEGLGFNGGGPAVCIRHQTAAIFSCAWTPRLCEAGTGSLVMRRGVAAVGRAECVIRTLVLQARSLVDVPMPG